MSEPTQKEKDNLARTINQLDMITEMLRIIDKSLPPKTDSNLENSAYEETIHDLKRDVNNGINELAGAGVLARRFGWVPEKGKW